MDERRNPRTTETEDDEQTWEQEGGSTERPRVSEDDTTTRTKTRPDMPQPHQKPEHKPEHKPQPQHKTQQTPEKKK